MELLVHALDSLQSLLPVSTGLLFIATSTIRIVTTSDRELRPILLSKATCNAALVLMVGILSTYSTGVALLLNASYYDGEQIPEDIIVFSLQSILLWILLIGGFISDVPRFEFSQWNCWMVYVIGESVLFFNSSPRDTLHRRIFILQIARLVVLLLLCSLVGSQWLYRRWTWGCDQRDFETEVHRPLLHGSANYRGYSTNVNNFSYTINSGRDSDSEKEISISSQSLEVMRFAFPLFWPKRRFRSLLLFTGVGLCLLADRLLVVYVPLQLGTITNTLVREKVLPWGKIAFFVFLRLLRSTGGITALREYMWLPLERYASQRIEVVGFDHVMNLSCDFHDNKSSGSVWHAISRGTVVLNVIRTSFFQLMPMSLDLLVSIIVLHVTFGPYMGLFVTAMIGLFLWCSSRIVALQRSRCKEYMSATKKEVTFFCEAMNNWNNVTWFNRIDYEKHSYSVVVDDRLGSDISVRRWGQMEVLLQSVVLSLGLMGACSIMIYQNPKELKLVGNFIMLLGYWSQLSVPLQVSSSGFTSMVLDLAYAEEFVSLLKIKSSITDRPGAKKIRIQPGVLSFKDVTFSYDKRLQALKGITFEAQPGQTIALVGDTGSGKSTILKLLLRLYDPDYGSIEIDGQNISDVLLRSLRNNIGIVPQNPILLNDSLFNNLKYAQKTATITEIHRACAAVGLHERFLSFPDGYETKVGEQGVKLSAGELRRIAIARVILKDPKYVLLDEPAGTADSETTHVQHSLTQLAAGRTTLVVTHRLSTIIKADQILVLKDGSVIERGNHQNLIKRNGYYHRLWKQQVNLSSRANRPALKPDAPEFVPMQMMN